MSKTGREKLKSWRESAQNFLTDTLNSNMTPKKRKQPDITDLLKNTSIKNDLMPQNRISMRSLIIRPNSHYKTHFLRGLTGSYNERGL